MTENQKPKQLGPAVMLDRLRHQIAKALPSHVTLDRFMESCYTALLSVRDIGDASDFTFEQAVMAAAQMGVEVNTPTQAGLLVCRQSRKSPTGYAASFQLGYQGMIDLALRSGLVRSIMGLTAHVGDRFEEYLGDRPRLIHRRRFGIERSEQTMVAAYAVAQLSGGGAQFVVLEPPEIYTRRDRGGYKKGDSYSPWTTDFLAMAAKTAVRDLYPWLPKSPQMVAALRYAGEPTLADDYEWSNANEADDPNDAPTDTPKSQQPPKDPPPPWDGVVDLQATITAGKYAGSKWADVGDEEWLSWVLDHAVKNERVCEHAKKQLGILRAEKSSPVDTKKEEPAKTDPPKDAAPAKEEAPPAKPKPTETIDPMKLLVPLVLGLKPGTRWCDIVDEKFLSSVVDREGTDGSGVTAEIADRAMTRVEQIAREKEAKETAATATAPTPAKPTQAPKQEAKK